MAAALLGPGVMLGAILTDHEEVAGNLVERGAFDLVADGNTPIELYNAIPGSWTSFNWGVRNNGTIPAMVVVAFTPDQGAELLDATELALTYTVSGGGATDTYTWDSAWAGDGLTVELGAGQVLELAGTITVPEELTTAQWDALPDSGAFTVNFDAQQSGGAGVNSPAQWDGI